MNRRKPVDERYGRLAVVSPINGGWLCRCDCGAEKVETGTHLRSGAVVSCGCANRERIGRPKTHGKSESRVYIAWRSMLQRCNDRTQSSFYLYGGRGISVCERWQRFENFLADMGEPGPGMSLDRIEVNGNYEPGNCRWANRKEQARNRRGAVTITVHGQTKTLAEWCELAGVKYHTAYGKLRNGVAPEKVFQR